ncbi:hypothetical protein SCHPADRAFT_896800, partial [Schizopora paradoxa]
LSAPRLHEEFVLCCLRRMASPKFYRQPSEDREATGSQRDFYGAASCKCKRSFARERNILERIAAELYLAGDDRQSRRAGGDAQKGTVPMPNDVNSLRLTSHRSARHSRWADIPLRFRALRAERECGWLVLSSMPSSLR